MKKFLGGLIKEDMESEVEKYIENYTKHCSNEISGWNNGEFNTSYQPWLTPDHTREVAYIARKEVIDKTLEWLKPYLYDKHYVGIIDLCDEYIKTMREEGYL